MKKPLQGGRPPWWLASWRWAKALLTETPVFNPHSRFINRWNELFVVAALVGWFIDPLFFFLLGVLNSPAKGFLCIDIDWTLAITLSILRLLVDSWYWVNIAIAFRTAYVLPSPGEKRGRMWGCLRRRRNDPEGVAPGELVFDSQHIALNYVSSPEFLMDVACAIPFPQLLVLAGLPAVARSSTAMSWRALVVLCCLGILLQAVPRGLCLFSKFRKSTSGSGALFDSAWATFLLNMSAFFVFSHWAGAVWYLLTVQSVNRCFHTQCSKIGCFEPYRFCPWGEATVFPPPPPPPSSTSSSTSWSLAPQAAACLVATGPSSPIDYGIFVPGVVLTYSNDFFSKYLSSLFYGYKYLTTASGEANPSAWIPEVIYCLVLGVLGLLLLAFLIGSMSNYLQALSRRYFEYQMNSRDVNLWMGRRNIPSPIQRRVQELLQLQWATTRGVEDAEVLDLLSEDLQNSLRRKLCEKLLTASPLFKAMKQSVPRVLDAFIERLQQCIYINGTVLVREGYPVTSLFFVLKGSLDLVSTRSVHWGRTTLGKGDFIGEELLVHFMERTAQSHTSARQSNSRNAHGEGQGRLHRALTRKISHFPSKGQVDDAIPPSPYKVECVGPVEGYSLAMEDLEVVCRQHATELLNPEVIKVLNQCSWRRRVHAAITIQVAWRQYLRRKHGWSLRELVEATQQRQRLRSLPRSEGSSHSSSGEEDTPGVPSRD